MVEYSFSLCLWYWKQSKHSEWLSLLACRFYFLSWHCHEFHIWSTLLHCAQAPGGWVTWSACTLSCLLASARFLTDKRKCSPRNLAQRVTAVPGPGRQPLVCSGYLFPLFVVFIFVTSLLFSTTCCGFLDLCLILCILSPFTVLKLPSVAVITLLWDTPNLWLNHS